MKIYAPRDDNAYHRTIYVFACKVEGCAGKSGSDGVAALVQQLPRQNQYYPYQISDDDDDDEEGEGQRGGASSALTPFSPVPSPKLGLCAVRTGIHRLRSGV